MKIKNGVVKNINKKILSGAVALTLLTVSLTGCTSQKYQKFEYSVNEQGEYQVNGTIDYELLKNCWFLVIDNPKYNIKEFYICDGIYHWAKYSEDCYSYANIFNNQEVFNPKKDGNRSIIFSTKVDEFLLAYNNVKANYTKEDIEQLLEQMKNNYEKENNKQLIKQ